MIIVSTEGIEGQKVSKVLGVVQGNTVRARHVGRDIMAGFKNIFETSEIMGGAAEILAYGTAVVVEG